MFSMALTLALILVPTNPSDGAWAYNVDASGVALDGYDVVGYHEGVIEKGRAVHATVHDGVTYWFATAARREAFLEDPEGLRPVCGGWDAFVCGVDPVQAGFAPARARPTPTAFRMHEGRLLMLSDRPEFNTLGGYDQNPSPEDLLHRADRFWADRLARAREIGLPPRGMNPAGRMELADWKPLLGEWRCEGWIQAPDGSYRTIGTADWIWRYGYDGYVVEDWWRPHSNPGNSGPAFRIYDPLNEEWGMVFMPSSGASANWWRMKGNWVEGELRGRYEAQGGQVQGTLRFYDITDARFRWISDRSTDAGETWTREYQTAECERIGH